MGYVYLLLEKWVDESSCFVCKGENTHSHVDPNHVKHFQRLICIQHLNCQRNPRNLWRMARLNFVAKCTHRYLFEVLLHQVRSKQASRTSVNTGWNLSSNALDLDFGRWNVCHLEHFPDLWTSILRCSLDDRLRNFCQLYHQSVPFDDLRGMSDWPYLLPGNGRILFRRWNIDWNPVSCFCFEIIVPYCSLFLAFWRQW